MRQSQTSGAVHAGSQDARPMQPFGFSGTGRAGQRIEKGRRLGTPWLKLCLHSSVPLSDYRCRAGHDEAEADSKTQQGHVATGPR